MKKNDVDLRCSKLYVRSVNCPLRGIPGPEKVTVDVNLYKTALISLGGSLRSQKRHYYNYCQQLFFHQQKSKILFNLVSGIISPLKTCVTTK